MAPVGEVSPVWISLHTTPLPGRFGVGGFGRLGGMYCIVCELPRALSRTPRIEIPPSAPKVCPEAFPIKASDHSGVGTLLLLPSRGRVAAD